MKFLSIFLILFFALKFSEAQKSYRVETKKISEPKFDSLRNQFITSTHLPFYFNGNMRFREELFDTTKHNFSIRCRNNVSYNFIDSFFDKPGMWYDAHFKLFKKSPNNLQIVYEDRNPKDTIASSTIIIDTEKCVFKRFWGIGEFNSVGNLIAFSSNFSVEHSPHFTFQIWSFLGNEFKMIYTENKDKYPEGIEDCFWINENQIAYHYNNNFKIAKIISQ